MAETIKTFAADANDRSGAVPLRQIGGQSAKALYSAVVNEKRALPTAIVVAADTPTGSVAGLTKLDAENKPHLALHARFTGASDRMTVRLALYDTADALIGLSPSVTLAASAYTDGTKYLATREIIDIGEAAKVAPVVSGLSGAADLYLVML